MAYQGRKPLTDEQRAQRAVASGGLLNEDEQDQLLDLVRSGVVPTTAIKQIKKSINTLYNTLTLDKVFQAEFDLAKTWGLCEILEVALVEKATGKGNVKTTTWYQRVYENGKPMYEDDGVTPKKEYLKSTVEELPPDNGALALWLKAYRPERYQPVQRIEHSGTLDAPMPEQVRSDLAAHANNRIAGLLEPALN